MLKKRNKLKKKVKNFKRKIQYLAKKHKLFVLFFLFFLVFIIWIKIAYNHYINNPKNIVKNVFFEKNIINNPDLTWLIKFTQNILSGTNTIKNKFLKYKSQIEEIVKHYPFVNKVYITPISKDSVKVKFSFKKPIFIFVWSWYIFPVYTKNLIYKFNKNYLSGINLSWEKIYLPKYLLNKSNLNNIFWKNSPWKILKYYKTIKQTLPKSTIIYLAWWEYFKVINNQKTYYFSLSKDIKLQLNQLELIKVKLPEKFKKSKEIDLGSLKNWVYLWWIGNNK